MNQINEICVALTQIPLDKMKDCCQQGQLHRLMAFLVRETPQDIQPIIQLLGSDIVEAYLLSLAKQPNQWVDLSLPEVVSTSVTSLELQQGIKRNKHPLSDWVTLTDTQRLTFIITLSRSLTLSNELAEPDFSQLPTAIKNIIEHIYRWKIHDICFLNDDELACFLEKQSDDSMDTLLKSLDPTSIKIIEKHLSLTKIEKIKCLSIEKTIQQNDVFRVHHRLIQRIILANQQKAVSFKLERLNQYLMPLELNDFDWNEQVSFSDDSITNNLFDCCLFYSEACLQSNCIFWKPDGSIEGCAIDHYQNIIATSNDRLDEYLSKNQASQNLSVLLSTLLRLTLEQSICLFDSLISLSQNQVLEYFICHLQSENKMLLLKDIVYGQQDSRKTFPANEIVLDLQINPQPDKLKYNWLIQRLCELASQLSKNQRQQLVEKIETWPHDVHPEQWFQLEEIAGFSDRWVQTWLRNCSNEDLVIVLHDLNIHPLKKKVLINLSKRAAEMLEDNIEVIQKCSTEEIFQARQRLMKVARNVDVMRL